MSKGVGGRAWLSVPYFDMFKKGLGRYVRAKLLYMTVTHVNMFSPRFKKRNNPKQLQHVTIWSGCSQRGSRGRTFIRFPKHHFPRPNQPLQAASCPVVLPCTRWKAVWKGDSDKKKWPMAKEISTHFISTLNGILLQLLGVKKNATKTPVYSFDSQLFLRIGYPCLTVEGCGGIQWSSRSLPCLWIHDNNNRQLWKITW